MEKDRRNPFEIDEDDIEPQVFSDELEFVDRMKKFVEETDDR